MDNGHIWFFAVWVNSSTVWFDSSVPGGEAAGLSHSEPGGSDGLEEAVGEDLGAELAPQVNPVIPGRAVRPKDVVVGVLVQHVKAGDSDLPAAGGLPDGLP